MILGNISGDRPCGFPRIMQLIRVPSLWPLMNYDTFWRTLPLAFDELCNPEMSEFGKLIIFLTQQYQGQQPPRGREPPGPTCNGSELMAEFRQVLCEPNPLDNKLWRNRRRPRQFNYLPTPYTHRGETKTSYDGSIRRAPLVLW